MIWNSSKENSGRNLWFIHIPWKSFWKLMWCSQEILQPHEKLRVQLKAIYKIKFFYSYKTIYAFIRFSRDLSGTVLLWRSRLVIIPLFIAQKFRSLTFKANRTYWFDGAQNIWSLRNGPLEDTPAIASNQVGGRGEGGE